MVGREGSGRVGSGAGVGVWEAGSVCLGAGAGDWGLGLTPGRL